MVTSTQSVFGICYLISFINYHLIKIVAITVTVSFGNFKCLKSCTKIYFKIFIIMEPNVTENITYMLSGLSYLYVSRQKVYDCLTMSNTN